MVTERVFVPKKERDETIEVYLGEENLKYLRSISKDELTLFESTNIDVTRSYIIKGDRKLLKQFKAYFIANCAFEHYTYATFMLKEYVTGLAEKTDDEVFMASSERDLLFLYVHSQQSGVGNTETWMCTSAIDRAANRARKGLVTVILSERDIPEMESSSEFITIDLGGSVTIKKAAEVAEKIVQARANNANNSTSTSTFYG